MLTRVIKAILFVGIAVILPLAGRPQLIGHLKIMMLFVAGLVMLLTQPDLKGNEAKKHESTDRWSILAILIAGIISQVAPVIEWGYFRNDFAGNKVFTAIGLALVTGGMAFRIWSIRSLGKFFTSTVQIVEDHRLMRSGPYAIVRHPSYLGALVAIIGSGIFLNAPIGTALAAVFMSMAYWARLKAEEEVLSRTFGDEYEEYRKATPMIIPFINFHKRSTSFPSRDK